MAPYTTASSSDAIILYWIEPCHNGIESSDYHIQCRRVFTSGPEDSESDESVSVDTTDWIDSITVPVGDVIGSFRMTGAPDIVKLMGVRGKRRFGRKCSYPVAKLRAGKTYQFRIRARNDIGWSDFSGPSPICRTIGMHSALICLCAVTVYATVIKSLVFFVLFHY